MGKAGTQAEPTPPLPPLPKALAYHSFTDLPSLGEGGLPAQVRVSEWGAPSGEARHHVFYFGGMPASAEEPALHSAMVSKPDLYREKGVHLICIDKVGMGGTSLNTNFKIRRDWPRIVASVADRLGVRTFGVFGVSNGGPYVMSVLTADRREDRARCKAAAMVVGVSDVSASGYFSVSHPSGFFEGCFNSLPVRISGCVTWSVTSFFKWVLLGYPDVYSKHASPAMNTPEARGVLRRILEDGVRNLGRGAALDCQQGLSPLYSRPTKDIEGGERSAETAYRGVKVPVALWYGKQDSTVPLHTADWLADRLEHCTVHYHDGTHMLFLHYAEQIIDDLIAKMSS